MSLMAIILWALYPLSPWRRLHELARHLLTVIVRNLTDPSTVDWLCANPDDPEGVARIERCLDDLNAFTDFLIYQKARAILGLKPSRWIRPRPSPPQRRRTHTFSELYVRAEACALRFADVERLAERRAVKLARLLATNPNISLPRAGEGPHLLMEQQANSGGGPAYLVAPPFETTAPPVPHQIATVSTEALASLPRSGEEIGGRCASAGVFIFVSVIRRAGLRVRAPP